MILRFLLFALVLVFNIACNVDNGDSSSSVFIYNQHNNITSLDPAFAKSQNNIWAVNHIFSTLFSLDSNLNVVPSIANSYSIDSSGTVYTINIRDDIKFHKNECIPDLERRVTAKDVAYSFNRLIDTTLNAPGSWIFNGRVDENLPFRAINDSVLIIKLKQPFSPFISLLTMQYCSVVPHECIDFYGADFYKNPVGTGPFRFKRWVDNSGLFLIKNNDYFKYLDSSSYSNIDAIRTTFIGERSIAFLELVNRRIDFFSGLESGYINTALDAEGKIRANYKGINFIKAPYLNFEYLGINPKAPDAHPLLAFKSFRQALNLAIDKNLMLQSLRNGVGHQADSGVIPKGLPSYDPNKIVGYTYDKEKSKSLINSYSSELLSKPLKIHTSKDYLDLTTFIAKQWEKIGLIVEIEVMESASLRNAMRNGKIPLFRASWIADYPDGENFLSLFYSQNPAPPNYTRFSNDRFDHFYKKSLKETDPKKKIVLYQSMDSLIIEESPVVFLFYDETALFVNNRVEGLSKNALNLLDVTNIVKTNSSN